MGNPVVHFEIGCKDKEQSKLFYEKLFGWKSEPYGPFSAKLSTGSTRGINGFTTALGHEPHNYVMLYVEVEEITPYIQLLESMGGSVMVPETQVPDSGSFAWCKDPAGNLFGLWNPSK